MYQLFNILSASIQENSAKTKMDKIWNYHAWPKPLFQNLPLYSLIKSTSYNITQYSFAPKFIDYIMTVCSQKQVPVEVLQLTFSIASRYMTKNNRYAEPTQLILLTSLFISGKIIGNTDGAHGGFSINQLHKFSNHCFTNKDFYRVEKRILQQLNFDVLSEGICDRQVKAILTMIKQILNLSYYQLLCKVCQDIQLMLWHHIYTKGDKERLLRKSEKADIKAQNKMENLLTAAIVQTSLILCTQCVGRFPATVWIIHVLELKEDELSLWVEDVLKIVLGRQKFQSLKL